MSTPLISDEVYEKLPDFLRTLCVQFENRERDIVLLSALAVTSCSLPNYSTVYRRKHCYPNLYVILVAPPASGKGVMDFSFELIKPIDRRINLSSIKKIQEIEDEELRPHIESLIIPCNISTSELYAYLNVSRYGCILYDNEIDTLSKMQQTEWSSYSDVLRKAYHHEMVSVARSSLTIPIKVDVPKLSLLLSGTPNQLNGLVKSVEDGLFSRLSIYYFEESAVFDDGFNDIKNDNVLNSIIEDLQKRISDIYSLLSDKERGLEFSFSTNQKELFYNHFKETDENIRENPFIDDGALSLIKRQSVMMIKISMILTLFRNETNLNTSDELICDDIDFITSMKIIDTLFKHSLMVYNKVTHLNFSENDKTLYDRLPDEFETNEVLTIGNQIGIKDRTIHNRLDLWTRKGLIIKVSHGKYKRKIK